MTTYPAIEAFAAARARAAITVGAAIDPPPGVTVAPRDDGVALAAKRIGERWNVDPAMRAIGDAIRAASR